MSARARPVLRSCGAAWGRHSLSNTGESVTWAAVCKVDLHPSVTRCGRSCAPAVRCRESRLCCWGGSGVWADGRPSLCGPDHPSSARRPLGREREKTGPRLRRLLCPRQPPRCLWPVTARPSWRLPGLAGVWPATRRCPLLPVRSAPPCHVAKVTVHKSTSGYNNFLWKMKLVF